MKNTKTCPKCQSGDIILIPGKREAGGARNLISVSRWNIFDAVAAVLDVCGSCGLIGELAGFPADIARAKARYAN